MRHIWFVANRLFANSGNGADVSRPAIRIATMGIAVGVSIMIISICVVLGFQNGIRTKLFGLCGHVQVLNYESLGAEEYKPIVIDREMQDKLHAVPHVRSVQRFCMKPGMLKTDEAFRGVAFRGVGEDFSPSFLREYLTAGEVPQFSDTTSTGMLLISKTLAGQLQLSVGSPVYAYFFENTVKARRFTVAGIYSTNLTDFDSQLVYCDAYTVKRLLGWDTYQYSGAELVLDSYGNLDETMNHIARDVNRTQDSYGQYYTSMSIREMYPNIFAWLGLLDMDVWAILILMVCVSGITMISGLLIIIMERTNFIGVMKAMGASNTSVRGIFMRFAAMIVLKGLVLGNILAFILLFLQVEFGLVQLDAETYYMDTVPVLVNVPYIVLTDVGTLAVCMLALLIPSYVISNIHPARSIRFE